MNLNKIRKDFPKAYSRYKKRGLRNRIDYFDSIGIRILLKYAANGAFNIEIRRKKSKEESEGEHDWKMVREAFLGTYQFRKDANDAAYEYALEIHEERLTK